MTKPTELIVATFASLEGATGALKAVQEMDKANHSVKLGNILVMSKENDEKINVQFSDVPAVSNTLVFGLIAGAVIGGIAALPLVIAGSAVGAGAAAAGGMAATATGLGAATGTALSEGAVVATAATGGAGIGAGVTGINNLVRHGLNKEQLDTLGAALGNGQSLLLTVVTPEEVEPVMESLQSSGGTVQHAAVTSAAMHAAELKAAELIKLHA